MGQHQAKAPSGYFDASEAAAVEDFWRIYDASYDAVYERMRAEAVAHPDFRRVVDSMSEAELTQLRIDAHGRLARALRGDVADYEAALRAEAVVFAEFGVGFADWYAVMRAIPNHLAPLLIAEYGACPARLDAVLHVMRKYLDHTMAVVGTAYVDAKERARKRFLATTLESIADGVIATDLQGRVVRMNTVAQQLTGYSLADALQRPLMEVFRIVDERTGEPRESPVDVVLRESKTVGLAERTLLVAKDCRTRPIAETAAPIRDEDGSIQGVVLVFRDLTKERAAARAARENAARREAILDAALDAVVTMNHEGKLVEIDAAATRMFGLSRSEATGASCEIIVPPRLREAHRSGLARYLATGDATILGKRVELTALRADGTEFPVEIAVVRIAGDGPPMFTAYIRDISDAKRAREELERRKNEATSAAAALRASEGQLRALAARLRDAREEEGRRIAREVHDVLGQSLAALKMDVAWVMRHLAEPFDEQARAKMIERCAAMSDLADVTLQSVRRIASELRPGLLDDLGLEAALDWHAQEFARRTGIHVDVVVPTDAVPLERDVMTALFRVFQEALANVARHAAARNVSAKLATSNNEVVLEISDDGRGIRADDAVKPGALGIVGMRERAALLGGTLEVARREEGGTMVTVRVPITRLAMPA